MTYKLQITRKAQKALAKLSADQYRRVSEKILILAETPYPKGCLKLTGRDAWRIRIGQYRVIYEIAEDLLIVTVIDIGHRKEIYR